ncbi:MAG: hypothetical protein ABSD48_16430 [Armatimonadota bacterium]
MPELSKKPRRVYAHIRLHGLPAAVEARALSPKAKRTQAVGESGRCVGTSAAPSAAPPAGVPTPLRSSTAASPVHVTRAPVVLCDESGQRVISASPGAMRRGVRPGQSLWEAQRHCPDITVADADPEKYQYHWQRAIEICGDYSPSVHRGCGGQNAHDISLDLTGTERLFGPARNVAQEIRNRLRVEVGVLASVGLGPNRTVALLAADSTQPGEIREVFADEAVEFVGNLPIFALPGADSDRIARLGQLGIKHARDLAKLPPDAVERALGDWGRRLWEVANGNDPEAMTVAESTIQPAHHAAGQPDGDVSGEADLRPSSDARERVHTALRLAAEQASRALRHQGQIGRQIAIELVFRDLRVVGARRTLRQPTRSSEVVFYAARDLLDKIKLSGRLVRRVRIRIARLTIASDGGQLPLPLFERETRRERLAEMVERVRDRFGETALQRANVAELTRR